MTIKPHGNHLKIVCDKCNAQLYGHENEDRAHLVKRARKEGWHTMLMALFAWCKECMEK